jgi:uncharacterized protein (TIGR04141 family)
MSNGSLKKLSAYRLEVDAIDGLAFDGYECVAEDEWTSGKQFAEFRLFFLDEQHRAAPWFAAFKHVVSTDCKSPRTLNSGFILLAQVSKNACYAVTGGIGHIHLRKVAKVTHHFGIELAKRILSEAELRSLSQRDTGGNVNAIDRRFRGRYSPLNDADNFRRILKCVRGKLRKSDNPLYGHIGSSIAASEGLSVSGAKTFDQIMQFLYELERLWKSGSNKIVLPALERIDSRSRADLVRKLWVGVANQLSKFDAEAPTTMFLDDPEGRDLSHAASTLTVRRGRQHLDADSVDSVFEHVKTVLQACSNDDDRVNQLMGLELIACYDDGVIRREPLYKQLCGDVVVDNDSFFLDCAHWYHADAQFVACVARQLDNVECIDPSVLGLDIWDRRKFPSEDAYNSAHANHVLLDRRLVKLDNGTVEFCDLLTASAQGVNLIHVKKANGAALRELFAQGFVSAELFAQDGSFRDKIARAELQDRQNVPPLSHDDKIVLSSLLGRQLHQMKVVFAIFDETNRNIPYPSGTLTTQVLRGTLSTFAMFDLLNRCQHLRTLGYQVAVTRIRPYPARPIKASVRRVA